MRFFWQKKKQKRETTVPVELRVLKSGRETSAETVTSAGAAMAVASVYRCATLIASTVASLDFSYMKKKGGIYGEDETNALHYLLTYQPMGDMNAFDWMYYTVLQALLLGNAYIVPRVIMGEVTDLILISPKASVSHNTDRQEYTIYDTENGVAGTFKEDEVIHIFFDSLDGKDGVSRLTYASRTMSIAATGDNETLSRFATGGNVMGFVTNDTSVRGFGEYQDEELGAAARDIAGKFKDGTRIQALPGQADFKQISLSSADLQFLESRKYQSLEICRFFNVPPSLDYADTSNNYKSAEMASVEFMRSIEPILKRIEKEFGRKMIDRAKCCKYVFRFDRRGIYNLDLDSKANYQLKTIQTGVYTVNDWRRAENQPEVEGGDTVFLSTNLAAINSDKLTGNKNGQ